MSDPRPVVLTPTQVRTALAGGAVELRRKLRPSEWRLDGSRFIKGRRRYWELLNWTAARQDSGPSPVGNPGPYWHVPLREPDPTLRTVHRLYPLLRPGDRLWVREAWRTADWCSDLSPAEIESKARGAGNARAWAPMKYEAGGATADIIDRATFGLLRSAATMPRWASRLTLVVTGLRLEPGEPRPFVVEARKDA